MSLRTTAVRYVKGVGPARERLFANLGVSTVDDLFFLLPRRYEDRTHIIPIRETVIGDLQTVAGEVAVHQARRSWYTKKHVYEVVLRDSGGQITCVWFNQPYLVHYFKPGTRVVVYGKVDLYKDRLQMISPEYEIIDSADDGQLSMGKIVAIYPLTRGMTQRYIRRTMMTAWQAFGDRVEDSLPVAVRNSYRLLSARESIEAVHFPRSFPALQDGIRRISFEEFLVFQLAAQMRRSTIVQRQGYAHVIDDHEIRRFLDGLGIELTRAQTRVIDEILTDMRRPVPMLRLLQGDVGCGKTLVAVTAAVAAARAGHQAAVLVPTEILAHQHAATFQRVLANGSAGDLRVDLLVGEGVAAERERVLGRVRSGETDILVGTHALLSGGVVFKDLSFVVMDEQHKFGVDQRAVMSAKGVNPDVLVMTATPIPRTLSLTLFGDLDISTIDELPPGRGTVVTRLISMDQAAEAYALIRRHVEGGEQAYVVYPVVSESEEGDLKAAVAMCHEFQHKTFRDLRVGLVHGQMKRRDADEAMDRFKRHEIDILVATTVLEVGIDVPNASVMVIEHAERFGLAQLHQLRGRIGRGGRDGICVLLADPTTEGGFARLEVMKKTSDGFEIAEEDLRIRGPGRYFGRHQHGMNELRFGNPLTQTELLTEAGEAARRIAESDPGLIAPEYRSLRASIQERYPGFLENLDAA